MPIERIEVGEELFEFGLDLPWRLPSMASNPLRVVNTSGNSSSQWKNLCSRAICFAKRRVASEGSAKLMGIGESASCSGGQNQTAHQMSKDLSVFE